MGFVPHQLIPQFDNSFERFALLVYPLCLLPVFILLWAERKHQKQLRTNPRGCRKLGLGGYSNLSDEYHPKYSEPTSLSSNGKPTEPWRIKSLLIYPIKSCAPVELNIADLSSTGLTWDRQFCFAEYTIPTIFPPDTPDSEKKQLRWTFRTLRKTGYERLIHVRPEVWVPDAEYVHTNRIGDPNLNGQLVINYPNIPQGTPLSRLLLMTGQLLHLTPKEKAFRVPLLPTKNHTYPLESLSIWKDIPLALNYGRHIPTDFKSYLGIPDSTPFTLFRAAPNHYREVYRNAPRQGTAQGEVPYQPIVAFPDAYPLHLLNLASVRDIADRVKDDIPHFTARRFRANIIVTGPKPYDEDDWKRIRIHPKAPNPSSAHQNQEHHRPSNHASSSTAEKAGFKEPEPIDFYTACHTIRCRLPNVDPDTSIRHDTEPDRTLRSFRCIDRGDDKRAALGLQLVPARPAGAGSEEGQQQMKLRVGDEIEVLQRGELVYLKA